MAVVKTVIDVSVNTGNSAANLRSLQDQVNSFFATLNKGSVVQSHFAQSTTKDFMELVNSTKTFTAEQMRLTTAAKRLDDTLSKGRVTLGQYFAGSFRKDSAEANAVMALARQRAQALETQFIQTSSAVNGFKDVIAIRPLQAFNSQLAVSNEALTIKRQMLRQATTSMINFGKNTQWAGRQLMVGFTVPMTIFGTTAGRVFKEIDQAAVRFKKVYGDAFTTPEELEKNIEAVKNLSAEFTKYGIAVKDTISLAAEAAAAGAKNEQLISATTEATRLATLGQLEQQEALTATIALQNAFKLSTTDLTREINFLNMVENQTVVTLQDLAQAIPIVAPVVVGLGGDVRDLAAMMAAMQEGGVGAAQAANALKSGLGSLINPSKQAKENLMEMGIALDAIVEANRGDLMGTVKAFAQALSTLDEFSRQQALEDVFGKYQYARLGALFDNIIGKGTQASRVMELAGMSAQQMGQSAQKELDAIAEATSTKFTAAIERFKLSIAPIGEMFMKLATPIVNLFAMIAEKFAALPSFMKNFALIGAVIVGVVIPAGTMFLGLLMNLIGTLTKFTQLTGIAAKGFKRGGLFGAVDDVTQTLKYSSLAEIDAANAAAQLGDSSRYANEALEDHVSVLGDTTAALEDLEYAYKAVIEKQTEMAALIPQTYGPGAVAAGLAQQAGPIPPREPIPPQNRNAGGRIFAFSRGNRVPGQGNTDTVPAMLTPGEFVVNKQAAQANLPLLHAINDGKTVKMNTGGKVPGIQYLMAGNAVNRLTPREMLEQERKALLIQREMFPGGGSQSLARASIAGVPSGTRTLDQLSAAELQMINDMARPLLARRGIQEELVKLLGSGIVPITDQMNQGLRLGRIHGAEANAVFSNPALYSQMLSTAAAQTQLAMAGVSKADIQGFLGRSVGKSRLSTTETASDAVIYKIIEEILGGEYPELYQAIQQDVGAGRFGLSQESSKLLRVGNIDPSSTYGEILAEMVGAGNVTRQMVGDNSGFIVNIPGLGSIAITPGKTFKAEHIKGVQSYERMTMPPGTVRGHVMPGVSPTTFANKGGMIPGIQYFAEQNKQRQVQVPTSYNVVTQTQGTKPEDLLMAALESDPQNEQLQSMLNNFKSGTYGQPELDLLDDMIAATNIDSAGQLHKDSNKEEGIQLLLSSLKGDQAARSQIQQRRAALAKYIQIEQEKRKQEALKSPGTTPPSLSNLVAVHSTKYGVERDSEGNVLLNPSGHYTEHARSSTHFTINGAVTGHIGGSWDASNPLIVTNAQQMVDDNGNPIAMNPVDTWWTTSPGEQVKLTTPSIVRPYTDKNAFMSALVERGLISQGDPMPLFGNDVKNREVLFFGRTDANYTDEEKKLIDNALGYDYDQLISELSRVYTPEQVPQIIFDQIRDKALELAMIQQGVSKDQAVATRIASTNLSTDPMDIKETVFSYAGAIGAEQRLHASSPEHSLETAYNPTNLITASRGNIDAMRWQARRGFIQPRDYKEDALQAQQARIVKGSINLNKGGLIPGVQYLMAGDQVRKLTESDLVGRSFENSSIFHDFYGEEGRIASSNEVDLALQQLGIDGLRKLLAVYGVKSEAKSIDGLIRRFRTADETKNIYRTWATPNMSHITQNHGPGYKAEDIYSRPGLENQFINNLFGKQDQPTAFATWAQSKAENLGDNNRTILESLISGKHPETKEEYRILLEYLKKAETEAAKAEAAKQNGQEITDEQEAIRRFMINTKTAQGWLPVIKHLIENKIAQNPQLPKDQSMHSTVLEDISQNPDRVQEILANARSIIKGKTPVQFANNGGLINGIQYLVGGGPAIGATLQGMLANRQDQILANEPDVTLESAAQRYADVGYSKLTPAERTILSQSREPFVGPQLFRGAGASSPLIDSKLRAALINGSYYDLEGDIIPFPKGSWSTDERVAFDHMNYHSSENQEWDVALDMLTTRGSVPMYGKTYKEFIKNEQAAKIRALKNAQDDLEKAKSRLSEEQIAKFNAELAQLKAAADEEYARIGYGVRETGVSSEGVSSGAWFTPVSAMNAREREEYEAKKAEKDALKPVAQDEYKARKAEIESRLDAPRRLEQKIQEIKDGMRSSRDRRKAAFKKIDELKAKGANIKVFFKATKGDRFIPPGEAKIDYITDLTEGDLSDPLITKTYRVNLLMGYPEMIDISGKPFARYGGRTNEYEFIRANKGGVIPQYLNIGGGVQYDSTNNSRRIVPGQGNTDTVPAMLTPGEFVVNKKSTKKNLPLLKQINDGKRPGFNKGGQIPGVQYFGEDNKRRVVSQIKSPGLAAELPPQAALPDADTLQEFDAKLKDELEAARDIRLEFLIEESKMQGDFDRQRQEAEKAYQQRMAQIASSFADQNIELMQNRKEREIELAEQIELKQKEIEQAQKEGADKKLKEELEAAKRSLEIQKDNLDEQLRIEQEAAVRRKKTQEEQAELEKQLTEDVIAQADARTSAFDEISIGGESLGSIKDRMKGASGATKFKIGLGAATAAVGAATAAYSQFADVFGTKNPELERVMGEITTGLGLASTAAALIPGPFGIVAGVAAGVAYAFKVMADRTNEAAAEMAKAGANLGVTANGMEKVAAMTGTETPLEKTAKMRMGLTPRLSEELAQNQPYQNMIGSQEGQKFLEELKNATSADRMKKVGDMIAYGIASGAMTEQDAKLFGKGIAAELADPGLGMTIGKNIVSGMYESGAEGFYNLGGQRSAALEATGLTAQVETAAKNITEYKPSGKPAPGEALMLYGTNPAAAAQIISANLQAIKDFSNGLAVLEQDFKDGKITREEYDKKVMEGSAEIDRLTREINDAATASEQIGVTMGALKTQLDEAGTLTAEEFGKLEEAAQVTGETYNESRQLFMNAINSIVSGATTAADALDLLAQIAGTGAYEGQTTPIKEYYDKAVAQGQNDGQALQLAVLKQNLENNALLPQNVASGTYGNATSRMDDRRTNSQVVEEKALQFASESATFSVPQFQTFLQNLSEENQLEIITKMRLDEIDVGEVETLMNTVNTTASKYSNDFANSIINATSFANAGTLARDELANAIGEAGAAGVDENLVSLQVAIVDESEEPLTATDLANKIKSLSRWKKQVDTIPDEIKKSLKIDVTDPEDLEKFGTLTTEEIKQIEENYKLLDLLPDNIEKDAIARFVLLGEDGKPLNAQDTLQRMKQVRSAYADLEKVKGQAKVNLGIKIVQQFTDPQGNQVSEGEANNIVSSVQDKLDKWGVELDNIPPKIIEQIWQLEVDIQGIPELIAKKEQLLDILKKDHVNNKEGIAAAEQEIAAYRGLIEANKVRQEWLATDNYDTSGGGGGQKSLFKQMQEELKNLKRLLDAMNKYIDTNKDIFKKIASGPFAPEFIEYLKGQGEQGLKILEAGGKQFQKHYDKFVQIQMAKARLFARSFGAITGAQAKSVTGQTEIIQKLIDVGGMTAESAKSVAEALGPDIARAYAAGDQEVRKMVARMANTKDGLRLFELAIANTTQELNMEANSLNNVNGLMQLMPGLSLENAQRLNELGISAQKAGAIGAAGINMINTALQQIDSNAATSRVQAIRDAFDKMGQDIQTTNNITATLGSRATPELIDRLKELGITYQSTSEEIRNAAQSLAYYDAQLEKTKDQVTQATELADAWTNVLQAQIEKINRLEIRPIEKAISALQDKIKGVQDEIELLREKEKEIQKVYDQRVKSLEEVQRANQRIMDQQRGQLDVASALSRGDVAGAAQAALQLQQTMAQGRMEDTREALDTQFESERLEITTQIEEKEKSIKAINDEIELKQKEIEKIKERQLALEEKMYQLALLRSAAEARGRMISAAQRQDQGEFNAAQAELSAIGAVAETQQFDSATFGSQVAAALTSTMQTILSASGMTYDAAVQEFGATEPGKLPDVAAMTVNAGTVNINGKPLGETGTTSDIVTNAQGESWTPAGGGLSSDKIGGKKPQGGKGQDQEDTLTPEDIEKVFLEKFSDLAKAVQDFLGPQGLQSVLFELLNGMVSIVNGFFDQAVQTLNNIEIVIPPISITWSGSGVGPDGIPVTASGSGQTAQAKGKILPLTTIVLDSAQKMAFGGNVNYKGSKERAPGLMFGGRMKKYAMGSFVPGAGMTDKVPALLTPGEFVVRKPVAQQIGPLLSAINSDVFPKINLGGAIPKPAKTSDNPVQYNYNVEVNVAETNASPDDIANAVMYKINRANDRQIRSIKVNGNS